jgi:hypothetical protein
LRKSNPTCRQDVEAVNSTTPRGGLLHGERGGVDLTGERGLTCSGFMATNGHRLLCGFHFFSSRCFRLPMDVPLSRLTGQLHKIVADFANSKCEESEHGIESLLRPSVLQHSLALSNALLLAPLS